MVGRPRKPTAIKVLEGNPGHRPMNLLEPKPREIDEDRFACRAPKHLTHEQRRWWRYYGRQLAAMRVLTEADLMLLDQMAKITAELFSAEADLAKKGPLYRYKRNEEDPGYVQVSPVFIVTRQLREQLLKCLRECGLTPSARTRVNMIATPDRGLDPLELVLCGELSLEKCPPEAIGGDR